MPAHAEPKWDVTVGVDEEQAADPKCICRPSRIAVICPHGNKATLHFHADYCPLGAAAAHQIDL